MVKKSVSRRTIILSLKDAPGRRVFVAGSFNDWQPVQKMSYRPEEGVYRCRILLAPGKYEYKFLVDDEWRSDPENPNFVPNGFGSLNSVLDVEEK